MRSSNQSVWCWFISLYLSLCTTSAMAQGPVHFSDVNLKAAVESALNVSNPTSSDMLALTELNINYKRVTDLTGLEHASNLTRLQAAANAITDITPLSTLVHMTHLDLYANRVSDLSPLSGMTNLGYLNIEDNNASDLSPLSGLTSLRQLYADNNGIADISALSGMHSLMNLDIDTNQIYDISMLAGLQALVELNIDRNQISDIAVVANLTSLNRLELDYNQITDISPIASLHRLTILTLTSNPLNEDACSQYIPIIQQNNPGLDIEYDACSGGIRYTLTITSTQGGSVTVPGEGMQGPYTSSTFIVMNATPNAGYAFSGWTGSAAEAGKVIDAQSASTAVIVDGTYTVTANFYAEEHIPLLFVDDNAPADPGPGDWVVSDALEDGTVHHPFDSIQEAVDLAVDGFVIQVLPGTYYENIDFQGKAIEIRGMDPNDPNTGDMPLLYGLGQAPAIRFTETLSGLGSVLKGMAVVGGKGSPTGAIECLGCTPTLINCLITGTYSGHVTGGAVTAVDCNLMIMNSTIADNSGGALGAGIVLENSQLLMLDSIVWGNTPRGIRADATSLAVSQFCDVQEQGLGPGNILADPCFVRSGAWVHPDVPILVLTGASSVSVWLPGDYHLKSQAGHWDDLTQTFVQDDVTSPCIDAGLESASVGQETDPNGQRLNQGVYGGSVFASRTYTESLGFVIKDANLKAAIQDVLFIWGEPTEEDLMWVTSMDLRERGIKDLTGIQAAHNLQILNLRRNQVTDVSPLKSLTQLRRLDLSENGLSDLSGVATLTQLSSLDVHGNGVTDLSPLSGMTQLTSLTLRDNKFQGSLSALSSLTNLESLDLQENFVYDLRELRYMTGLKDLKLAYNVISEVSVLANMAQMETLDLRYNILSDISPLTQLTHLKSLFLEGNPLDSQAGADIQAIRDNNPGIDVRYD
ncbi:MAG: leucine-rich repeat domain-containing protein [Phycisphaerae bacterium]|nr:leucine-rich repeat domain-containing protein [Phycisphaerae bacterium]